MEREGRYAIDQKGINKVWDASLHLAASFIRGFSLPSQNLAITILLANIMAFMSLW
jgi:hypothetical protein